MHSSRLAQYLRSRFEIPEDLAPGAKKLDFWLELQKRGLHLESLYSTLDQELQGPDRILLEDFAAIVRTAVVSPVGDRGQESVCGFHRALVESLEPGDIIINFNWDPVVADALLYHSNFWFPATGFGLAPIRPLLPRCQKAFPIDSLVTLFQIHGSTVLFEMESPESPEKHALLYLGPRQWSPIAGLAEFNGQSIEEWARTGGTRDDKDCEAAEQRLMQFGHIFLNDRWYRPIFTPPVQAKRTLGSWYPRAVRSQIHAALPLIRHIVVAGYSFPHEDLEHLRQIFVPAVLRGDLDLELVNQENSSPEFRARVERVFDGFRLSHSYTDFKEFCRSLAAETPDRKPVIRPELLDQLPATQSHS
jgi:hypothetical protein